MRGRADLHLHTVHSDGYLTCPELLEKIRGLKLEVFAVTDHDTVEGCREMQTLVKEDDPELMTGIELSADHEGHEVHLLGYGFDPEDKALNGRILFMEEMRNQRGALMVQKLKEAGAEISLEELERCAGNAAIGRAHVARVLISRGIVSTFEEAFRLYIGNNGPGFVPKQNPDTAEAIELLHQAGGVVVLAHPWVSGVTESIPVLKEQGLDGVEVHHPDHRQSQVDKLKHQAAELDLLITGGSDFHGQPGRCPAIGGEPVTIEICDRLKEAIANRRTQA